MKKVILSLIFLIFCKISTAQLYFPPISGNTWDTISPTSLGWCQDKIDTMLDYLDSKNTNIVFDIFQELTKDFGQTIIAVTHDDDFARKSDRIIEMKDGEIIR